eukprot:46927_1
MTQALRKIDKSIFRNKNNNTCNGYNDCDSVKRLMTALSIYQKVSAKPQKFIRFCDSYYSQQYLQDYVHCISVHKNDINKDDMNTKTCTLTKCASTSRHYRDRADKGESNDNSATSHLYFDIF